MNNHENLINIGPPLYLVEAGYARTLVRQELPEDGWQRDLHDIGYRFTEMNTPAPRESDVQSARRELGVIMIKNMEKALTT